MKRNSTTIFFPVLGFENILPWISELNANRVNGSPDFSSYSNTSRSIREQAWADFLSSAEELQIVPDPEIVVPEVLPDWDGLTNHILGGDLFAIYTRLTEACFLNPATANSQQIANANNIAVASGKLDQAVAVTRVEGAVAASFQLLVNTSDYRFTVEEKGLWQSVVDTLNFSPMVYLP